VVTKMGVVVVDGRRGGGRPVFREVSLEGFLLALAWALGFGVDRVVGAMFAWLSVLESTGFGNREPR
jgi:hypothetical protein